MPRFEINHAVLRYELLTVVIEANDLEEAQVRAAEIVNDIPYASYEPGDISETGDITVEKTSDYAELTDLDQLL